VTVTAISQNKRTGF